MYDVCFCLSTVVVDRLGIVMCFVCCLFFFFQAEDGIRDLVRSRGLGDVYKRQTQGSGQLAELRST